MNCSTWRIFRDPTRSWKSAPGRPRPSSAPADLRVTFISNANKVATAPVNSNLLRVSLREQGGIPFKCGGGLCGTCKCRIETGLQNTDEIKPKERNTCRTRSSVRVTAWLARPSSRAT